MKLFCAVLVIYVVALMLFGAEGHGDEARRHARDLNHEVANEEHPPPPKEFRSRRAVANEEHPPPPPPKQFRSRRAVANEQPPPPPKQFRQRRQAPPGLPPPPGGMPEGIPAPPM
ncbi:bromodomain-containing protein 4 isoform X2 [Drosophila obscura]|uniref:bromodomain-containing protein 4 isoform X2 n=1 Tax=Drosophila obscura TaxID=7282 RepID=UPI001BB23BAF|nr:bromodomain-containing protein 4 isoform X2 [Drosophila obscura]